MGLTVALLAALYPGLFDVRRADYVPALALGFVVWGFVSGVIADGCRTFVGARDIILQAALPLSAHVYRTVWSNLIVLGHNALVFLCVALIVPVRPGPTALLALPGLAALCLNAVWVCLLVGMLSARYRDAPPSVARVVRIAFFATPILWLPDAMPERALFLDLNPFHHALEVVRAPLLGEVPAAASWFAVAAITVAGWLATLLLFARHRTRIASWL